MFNKTKTEITTMAVKFVVEASTTFVVSSILKSLCPTDSKAQRVKLIVGSYAIASLVADRVGAAVEEQITEAVEIIDKIKNYDLQ